MKKNPFEKCKTVGEVVDKIRVKCEQLRGRKFGVWNLGSWWSIDGHLVLRIQASYTREKWHEIRWIDLADGAASRYFPSRSKIGRWEGFPITSSGGSGDGRTFTGTVRVRHELVPCIVEILEQNAVRQKEKDRLCNLSHDAYPLTDFDREVIRQWEEFNGRFHKWRMKLVREHDASLPIIDPMTGKPVKHGRRDL